MNINRNHKDSVFSFLFSNPDILRELYSAIEGITIPPDIPVDINTLSGVLFMKQVNDISFLIDNRINHGHNPEILKRCETLDNYSIFVEKIREYRAQGLKLEELITPVIEYCIKNNILKKFLKENSSEVRNMIFGEYDRDMDIAVNRREAREEGLEEGRKEGREEGREEGIEQEKLIIAKNLLEKGSTAKFVQEITGLSQEKIRKLL